MKVDTSHKIYITIWLKSFFLFCKLIKCELEHTVESNARFKVACTRLTSCWVVFNHNHLQLIIFSFNYINLIVTNTNFITCGFNWFQWNIGLLPWTEVDFVGKLQCLDFDIAKNILVFFRAFRRDSNSLWLIKQLNAFYDRFGIVLTVQINIIEIVQQNKKKW